MVRLKRALRGNFSPFFYSANDKVIRIQENGPEVKGWDEA
jgi:hypothetical protein